MSKARAMRDKALEVLQAAVVEAGGLPNKHVPRERVMERANIANLEGFLGIVEYLAGRGFIAEGGDDYEFFVVTIEGKDEAAEY